MILYRLRIRPSEYDSEAEDFDEWFTSLREAKQVRAKVIADNPCKTELKWGSDYEIDRVKIDRALSRELLLSILNRHAFWSSRTTVVAPYEGRPCVPAPDGRCRYCDRIVDFDAYTGSGDAASSMEGP